MIFDRYNRPGFWVACAFPAFSELDLEGSETSEFHGFAGEDGSLYLVEKSVNKAVDLFSVA